MTDALIELLAGRRGHFEMESGYHSDQWFDLSRLFDRPERLRPFVEILATRLAAYRVDAICGPEVGGALLAERIAALLHVACYQTRRIAPGEARGLFPVQYALPDTARARVQGLTIAIVDDAVSAGSAVRGTYADLVACGARPVAVGALFLFGGAVDEFAAEHGMSVEGLARTELGMWHPRDCPLCRAGESVEKVSDAAAP